MRGLSGIAAFLCLCATVASAEPPPLDESVRAQYEQGIALYKRGAYAEAIRTWKTAYAATAAPSLLFNIAQAYRLAGDLPESLTAYRGYLQQWPDAPNRAEVEARIVELERLMVQRSTATPRPSEPPRSGTVAPPGVALQPTTPPHPVAIDRPQRRRTVIAAVATLGALGTLSLITAGGLSLRAANDAAALREPAAGAAWASAQADRYEDGVRSTHASYALYAIGATSLVAGIVLAAVERQTLARRPVIYSSAGGASWRF